MATQTAAPDRRKTPAAAPLRQLKERLLEISDIGSAASVLSWDQSTYMPPGGATARGRQMARLQEIAHQKRIDPAIGRLLDKLEPYAAGLPEDADDARLLRVLRRDYERAIRVPAAFVARASAAASASYNAWTAARPANDLPPCGRISRRPWTSPENIRSCFPATRTSWIPTSGPTRA